MVTSQEAKLFPKVLVAIPTYEGKDYMLHNCFAAVKKFTYPNFEVIIIDNSRNINYYTKLMRLGYKSNVIKRVPRGDNSRQALCNAQNYARNKAITENFDYLLFVESDLLPQPNIIELLLSHAKKVVGSLYYIGTDIKVPCIFLKEYKKEHMANGTRLVGTKIQDGKKVLDQEEVSQYVGHGLKQVHGLGLGTTLISRDIFVQFPFWHDERFVDKHSDVYFYMDLDNAHIEVFVDTDIITPHYQSNWKDVKDR